MKICITSQGESLDSQVDPRFGRSQYFIIVDLEDLNFESIKNPNIDAVGGAGIQSAQFITNKGAKVLLTGHCGPNGFYALKAGDVDVIVGVSGTVKEAVEKYKNGELKGTENPDVMSEFGMPKKNYEL